MCRDASNSALMSGNPAYRPSLARRFFSATYILLSNARYYDDMRAVITSVWNGTRSDDACHEWGEVNEFKYLFRASRPWTRADANAFLEAAWRHVGFSA